jgi:hypothetical protein
LARGAKNRIHGRPPFYFLYYTMKFSFFQADCHCLSEAEGSRISKKRRRP